MGKVFKTVAKPFEKAFEWAGDMVAPEIDTSGQERAIRQQAQQQARQAAESARQAAESQSSAQQREQLLRQRANEGNQADEKDADVRVGDSGEYDTARKRRQQFVGNQGESQSPSIRI